MGIINVNEGAVAAMHNLAVLAVQKLDQDGEPPSDGAKLGAHVFEADAVEETLLAFTPTNEPKPS